MKTRKSRKRRDNQMTTKIKSDKRPRNWNIVFINFIGIHKQNLCKYILFLKGDQNKNTVKSKQAHSTLSHQS